MTSFSRSALVDFDFGSAVYAGATVTAYTVDTLGNPTATLATLYADLTSPALLQNPQTLDSYGQWQQPVYVADAVVLAVTDAQGVPDHQTGVISANLAGSAAADAATSAASASALFGSITDVFARVRALYRKMVNLGFPLSLVGKGLSFLRVNVAESAYEFQTPAQVRSDIGAGTVTSVADAVNGGVSVATGTAAATIALAPSDLAAKAVPTLADIFLIGDAAASFAPKKSTGAQVQAAFVLPAVIVQDRKATGVAGSALTQNVYTDRDLNTLVLNTVGGVTAVATPNLTLPAGTYNVTVSAAFVPASSTNSSSRIRLFNTTDAAVQVDTNANDIVSLSLGNAGQTGGNTITLRGRFTIAAQKNLKFQHWNPLVGALPGTASAGTGNTEPEVYLSAEFVKVA
jgi:hypothetical protein